jgi:hypothetical protein
MLTPSPIARLKRIQIINLAGWLSSVDGKVRIQQKEEAYLGCMAAVESCLIFHNQDTALQLKYS